MIRLRRAFVALRPWWRSLLRALLFAGPTLALVPLGALWLWERGWLLPWLGAMTVGVFAALLVARLWRPDLPAVALRGPEAGMSSGEKIARERLIAIDTAITAKDIATQDAAWALGERIVLSVAESFHPGVAEPTLRVTLPELLLVTERTTADTRRRLLTEFPILRDLSFNLLGVAQDLMAWSDRAMTAYRLGRLLWNPASAVVAEIQRYAVNLSTMGLTDHARQRIAQILAREVGEAAILLYSGRCRLDAGELAEASALDAMAGATAGAAQEPLRIVLVGQVKSGKSSLLNALAGSARSLAGHAISTEAALEVPIVHPVTGPVVLIDTPGLEAGAKPDADRLTDADMVLWTVALHRADRGTDAALLAALRDWTMHHRRRIPAPIIFVATHLDRLAPAEPWSPPYDLDRPGNGTRDTMGSEALKALRADLAWPEARWVAAVPGGVHGPWNLDAVRAAIAAARAEAEAARAARLVASRGLLARAADAGRSMAGAARLLGAEVTRGVPDAVARMRPGRDK